jgi:hypothetical protein
MTGYRIEAYTKWFRMPVRQANILRQANIPVTVCRRCRAKAAFLRMKFRQRAGVGFYDLTGYCQRHLPAGAPEKFKRPAE